MAHELGPFGITVNCIAPGFILSNPTTQRQWESYGPAGQERLVQGIAMRRLGTPADIANGVEFFVAERSSWVTEWVSPPFELTVDGDVIRGRGASDDKGPVYIVLKTAQAFMAQEGRLPLNVTFLFEGEEEIGSPHLAAFIAAHAAELAADLVISADGAMWRPRGGARGQDAVLLVLHRRREAPRAQRVPAHPQAEGGDAGMGTPVAPARRRRRWERPA
jgi:Peptidase family M20/M25/M40/Enoyl-(Acyl carrier protein) reductase